MKTTELAKFEIVNDDDMISVLLAKKVDSFQNKVQKQFDVIKNKFESQDKQLAVLASAQNKMNKMHEEQLALERKRHEVVEGYHGLVTIEELGNAFKTHIGRNTMYKLLRLVRISRLNQTGKTVPYSNKKHRRYVDRKAVEENGKTKVVYLYDVEKCSDKINEWLKKNGEFADFHAITDSKKLMEHINTLVKTYKK